MTTGGAVEATVILLKDTRAGFDAVKVELKRNRVVDVYERNLGAPDGWDFVSIPSGSLLRFVVAGLVDMKESLVWPEDAPACRRCGATFLPDTITNETTDDDGESLCHDCLGEEV
jgi:hypothetical protein